MSPLDQPTATLPAGAAMRPAPAGRPGGPWLRTRRARATLWQALAVVAMIALLLWLAGNARENMAARNISFGFDFLGNVAGFDIPFHILPWSNTDTYAYALLVCLVNTLLCAAMSIVLASALGLLIALMRLSGNPLAAATARAVMEIVRNTPQLVQIFFIYIAVLQALPPPRASLAFGAGVFLNVRGLLLPAPTIDGRMALLGGLALFLAIAGWFGRQPGRITGVILGPVLIVAWAVAAGLSATWELPALKGFNFVGGLRIPPELLALWLGLSIYTAAFISEIIRAAILAIQHGQTEASLSLGLSRGQTMYLVVLPQALRILIPPLTSQYLNIIKSTTLGAAIAYPDILQIFGRTVLNQSGRALEVMVLLLGVFLSVNLLTSALMNRWNRKLMLQGR
ncbi:MAG: ABC transporter permease subunit [Rhodospirillales bacterium]|nr:ABC transporter permease subunit [Rhodospirillales bacterium]